MLWHKRKVLFLFHAYPEPECDANLLAKDEHELATWLMRALARSGFQVDWVDDGRMVRRSL